MKVSVIICAAGRGLRAGFEKNKLLLPMPDKSSVAVLQRTVLAFCREDIAEIIIAVSPVDKTEVESLLADPTSFCSFCI